MNIFFIPSWYPSKNNPHSGLFIKEQALAIAENIPEVKVIISLWGNEGTKINFEKPLEVLPHLLNRWQDMPFQKKIGKNTWEYNTPALEWSARFFSGNIKRILKANLINFKKALDNVGPIDIIHAHVGFPSGFIAMKLATAYHLPYVITEHMGPFPNPPFSTNRKLLELVTGPLRKANQVVAVSPALKSEIAKYKIDSVVIPNMVEPSFFKLKFRQPGHNFVFFTLAEICPEKGIEDLIRAIKIVTKQTRNFSFHIGGKGKYLKKYQRLAKSLQIDDKIIWLGFLTRKRVVEEMQNCQAFVLPSYHESFGMVFAEALAAGKPVIGTRAGGPEAFISHNNGILVPVGRVDLIAKAMVKMKDYIDVYLPVEIRRSVINKFSSQAVSKQLFEIYQKIIKRF